MKLSLITMHSIKNYGSVLQTYASQKIFESYGFKVEIINYIRKKNIDSNLLTAWTAKDKGIKKALKMMVLFPTVQKWKKVFWSYLKENVYLTEHTYYTMEDFEKYPLCSDVYCTGSDQVWNSSWNEGIEKTFFLDFAPNDKPKIAFSASIGKSELDDDEIREIKPLLEKYTYITMRENTGLELIRRMGINNCGFCLDPTLLLTKEEWLAHSKPVRRKKKYVLIYQLNHNPDFDAFAVKFAKKNGLQLIRFCTRYDQIRLPGKPLFIPDVKMFPSLIANAEYVITDSFHATAFSINLNTEFISIYPEQFSSRISDILKLTGLENRHLVHFDQYNIADKPINFDSVNVILEKERKKSLSEIRKMLDLCN